MVSWVWLIIGYLDFMGAVMLGIMSFFSTRQILFNMSFYFRSVSTINSGAKVLAGLIWFNAMWWMYMVVWAAFIDIGRENEDERIAYNKLVEEENQEEEDKEKEETEKSQPGSATSERSGGKKLSGYEYVIPAAALAFTPAALAITSLDNSIKSVEGMDPERGLSAKSVELYDENGLPSSPPPAYSYLEPESESPMPAGIPFLESPPESRGPSAASTLPTASRLVSARSGLESLPGSRAVSAISTRTGPASKSGSRLGSAIPSESGSRLGSAIQSGSRLGSAIPSESGSRAPSAVSAKTDLGSRLGSAVHGGSRASSAGSELGSRLGSALSTRPASTVAGSPDPVFSSPATPGPGQPGATPGPPTISSIIGTPEAGSPHFEIPNMEAPPVPEASKAGSIADILMSRW